MANNLALWDKYQGTPIEHVKDFEVNRQHRKAVAPQYKKKRITEAFGPMGIGWGVLPDSESFDRQTFDTTTLLYYRAVAFYVLDGVRGEFPIASTIKEAYTTKTGYLKIDDEAVKKVRTDALTKGFTDLGFNADIHMGLYDDDAYVHMLNIKLEIEREEEAATASKELINTIDTYIKSKIDESEKCPTKSSKIKFLRSIVPNIEKRGIASGVNVQLRINRVNKIIQELELNNEQ